jgi:adenylate kinase
LEAKRFMDAGELVPDGVILGLVREEMARTEEGVILDGFPRTRPQAEALEPLLADLGLALDGVVVLDVPFEILVRRISGRRSCPDCKQVYNVYFDPPGQEGICDKCGAGLTHRDDDNEETVRRRLEVYQAQTEPLIAYYEGSGADATRVDGDRPVDAVQDQLAGALR